MEKFVIISAVLLATGLCIAAEPDEFFNKQRRAYLAKIEKADKAVEAAKEKRDKEVLEATQSYIKDLEKLKTYWTKQGKLEKALEFDKLIDEMQQLVRAEKPDFDNDSGAETSNNALPSLKNARFAVVKTVTLKHHVRNGWLNTEVTVKRGQKVRITIDGTYSPNGKVKTTAKGVIRNDWKKFSISPEDPHAAIIAYISGDPNDYYMIGETKDFVAKKDGVLFLGANDNDVKNNSGTISIKITY